MRRSDVLTIESRCGRISFGHRSTKDSKACRSNAVSAQHPTLPSVGKTCLDFSPLLASARALASHARRMCTGADDMGISFNTKSKKKNTLWAPATSRLNWREYRSRLITAETPAFMRRLSRETGALRCLLSAYSPWLHAAQSAAVVTKVRARQVSGRMSCRQSSAAACLSRRAPFCRT